LIERGNHKVMECYDVHIFYIVTEGSSSFCQIVVWIHSPYQSEWNNVDDGSREGRVRWKRQEKTCKLYIIYCHCLVGLSIWLKRWRVNGGSIWQKVRRLLLAASALLSKGCCHCEKSM